MRDEGLLEYSVCDRKRGGNKVTNYLTSAFSLNMLGEDNKYSLKIERWVFSKYALINPHVNNRTGNSFPCPNFESAVGHEGTAKLISKLLGIDVPTNRASIILSDRDVLYVAQPIGQRLNTGEEVATPELSWFKITLEPTEVKQAHSIAISDNDFEE